MTLFITTANQGGYQKTGSAGFGHIIGGSDQIVLANGATVSSDANANGDSTFGIFGTGTSDGSSLLVMGSVLSAGSTGIHSVADGYKVVIGATGAVYGGTHGIVLSATPNGSGGNFIENRGLVQGAGPSGRGITVLHSNNYVSNLGTVIGSKGILAGSFGLSSNNEVVNSGNIFASDIGVELYGDGSSLTNNGLIQSTTGAGVALQSEAGEALSVLNTGTIDANGFPAIVGGAGSDRVTNQGTIKGSLNLSDGDNLYDGRGGTVNGSISLGSGNDTIYGGAIEGFVSLNAGDDLYDGRGGTIGGVVILGPGSDTAYGGAGDEAFIDLNVDDDLASGGDGNDSFLAYSGGNDTFHGGGGIDSLTFDGFIAQGVVLDLRSTAVQKLGALGSLQLSGVEKLTTADGNDLLIGTSADNEFHAAAGGDTLEGGLGNDTLDGGDGFDYARFTGSTGAKVTLANGVATGHGTDTLLGIEGLMGGSGADSFTGNTAANTFYGNSGNDSLSGGDGADTLYGGAGKDRLTGGVDADVFVFNTSLNVKTNVDTITDFKAVDDTIRLENAVFKKLSKLGALSKSSFALGSKAKDSNDYIVYDKATGALSYDADGSGAGAAIKVAVLTGKPTLSAADFFVI